MVRIEGGDNDGYLHPPALAENGRFSTIGFLSNAFRGHSDPPDSDSHIVSTLLLVIAIAVTATPFRGLIT